MKHIKLFENFQSSNALETIQQRLIEGKYLNHLTFKGNVKSIIKNGLIPRHKPNNNYGTGVYSKTHYSDCPPVIFLTPNMHPESINLPDNVAKRKKNLVVLRVDVSQLDFTKFTPDDDFHINNMKYHIERPEWLVGTFHMDVADKYAKLNTLERAAMSLKDWGAIGYSGIIPPDAITVYRYTEEFYK